METFFKKNFFSAQKTSLKKTSWHTMIVMICSKYFQWSIGWLMFFYTGYWKYMMRKSCIMSFPTSVVSLPFCMSTCIVHTELIFTNSRQENRTDKSTWNSRVHYLVQQQRRLIHSSRFFSESIQKVFSDGMLDFSWLFPLMLFFQGCRKDIWVHRAEVHKKQLSSCF